MAEAVERLHEHHYGGDADAGDLGGVVERAGGEMLGDADGFKDGLVAEMDEIGVERDGFDGPDLGPLDGAVFFGGEFFTGGLSIGEHAREDAGVEVAHVERGFAAADYSGDDAGEGLDAAHGGDRLRVLAGDRTDFEGEPGAGGQGVAADFHGG